MLIPPARRRWWRIILDESHAIKQENTGHTKSVKLLVGENRWCVTGTPFNNSIDDICSQMNFVDMPPFNNRIFKQLFSAPHAKMNDDGYRWRRPNRAQRQNESNMPAPSVALFLALMRKFLMRHTKDQKRIGSETGLVTLPPKTMKSVVVDFTSEERRIYREWEVKIKAKYLAIRRMGNSEVMRHTLALFALLGPLRDICSGGKVPYEDSSRSSSQPAKSSKPPYQMQMGEETECSICLDTFESPVATSCKASAKPHIFCKDCIEGMIGSEGESTGSCPLCRDIIKISDLRPALLPKVKDEVSVREAEGERTWICGRLTQLHPHDIVAGLCQGRGCGLAAAGCPLRL